MCICLCDCANLCGYTLMRKKMYQVLHFLSFYEIKNSDWFNFLCLMCYALCKRLCSPLKNGLWIPAFVCNGPDDRNTESGFSCTRNQNDVFLTRKLSSIPFRKKFLYPCRRNGMKTDGDLLGRKLNWSDLLNRYFVILMWLKQ